MKKTCYLDHVAIAVENLDKAISVYEDIGLEFDDKREVVTEQKVKTAFAAIDENAHIELLESTHDDGPIARFIEKRGAGIHHICFRVESLEGKQKELSEKGIQFIYKDAKKGAGGCLVNFIHPKSTGGVLIELSEKL